ncbi:MAG: hypothetical protein HY366_02200 [Candidatus Aenigmarchaeota archaeon]|nr:hypothetical protein [Candidatus Aenigmarchaeota archaeon]
MVTRRETFLNLLVVSIGLLTAILQFYRSGDLASLAILGIATVVVAIYFIYDWIKDRFGRIEILTERINKVEGMMDDMKIHTELDKRLSVIEILMNRKGAVDPKTVMAIILVILFILYLRTAGFI